MFFRSSVFYVLQACKDVVDCVSGFVEPFLIELHVLVALIEGDEFPVVFLEFC